MLTSKTVQVNNKNGVCYITFPKLSACNTVNHGFSTRIGGVSEGHLAKMNLGLTNGENEATIKENYRRFCEAIGVDYTKTVVARQTHTTNVRIVKPGDIGKGVITERDYDNVDGLITDMPGVALVTLYADCVPLLFCDPAKRIVATSHSGWRGTANKMGEVTVRLMQEQFGCNPKDIIAAIAPCIGNCCYEVDTPVYEAFKANEHNVDLIITKKDNEHYMLNLPLANKQILLNAGIREENIDVSDICTCCNNEYLHSHRATNGKRGLNAAVIALK